MDEGQEKARQIRDLLAKSTPQRGQGEQVLHVAADRGGIAINAGGSVHIGSSARPQRKAFFTFGRLMGLYFMLFFGTYMSLRLGLVWQSQPDEQSLFLTVHRVGMQMPNEELLIVCVATIALGAAFAGWTRWYLRG